MCLPTTNHNTSTATTTAATTTTTTQKTAIKSAISQDDGNHYQHRHRTVTSATSTAVNARQPPQERIAVPAVGLEIFAVRHATDWCALQLGLETASRITSRRRITIVKIQPETQQHLGSTRRLRQAVQPSAAAAYLGDAEDGSARRTASAASTAERGVAEPAGLSRAIHRTARALRAGVQGDAGALPTAHRRGLPELLAGRLADTAGLRAGHQDVVAHREDDGDACD